MEASRLKVGSQPVGAWATLREAIWLLWERIWLLWGWIGLLWGWVLLLWEWVWLLWACMVLAKGRWGPWIVVSVLVLVPATVVLLQG